MIRTFTVQGKSTSDNRDVVIHFSHFETKVFIILDGATNCPSGGSFSRDLALEIESEFQKTPQFDLRDASAKNILLNLLKKSQSALQKRYILDFASLLLVIKCNTELLTVHSGDCSLGFIQKNGQISWVTPVHTAANIFENKTADQVLSDPLRHTLTRAFKAKKMVIPDFCYFEIPENVSIIMATDGFWALPTDTQYRLLTNIEEKIDTKDDASYIVC